jgi:CheY-like chemotaxis protein
MTSGSVEFQVPEQWQVMADAVPGLLAYLDVDRRLMLTNKYCKEWLGCDGDGVRGRRIEDVLGESGYSLIAPHLDLAASGKDCVFSGQLTTPVGTRAARISFLPHLDPPHRPKGYTALMLDLLDGEKDRESARQYEAELQRLRKKETAMTAAAQEFTEVMTGIGANVEACLSMLDSRHPLVPNLREIRRSLDRGASLTRRLSSTLVGESAAPAQGRAAASGNGSEDPSGKIVILLAEDEDAVRRLVSRILQTSGYHVMESSSGSEALELAAAHAGHIDLLLTDVVMSGMGGRELVQRLRPLRPETQVLYMSGYTDDAVLRYGLQADGIAFLAKPFAPATLLQKVREVLAPVGKAR